jgi:hypothetical protein
VLFILASLSGCDVAGGYLRGDRCVQPGTTYQLEGTDATLQRFETVPCVTIGGESRAATLLLYVLHVPGPNPRGTSGFQGGSQWTRWYARSDDNELEIDTRAATVLINGSRFELKDGNLFVKSMTGACAPRATQVRKIIAPAMRPAEVLEVLQSTLGSGCGVLSLKPGQR